MKVILNDKECIIPSSLSEVTLGQRIDFQNQYGNLLDKMAESIIAMEEGLAKELELIHLGFERMFNTIAFFTNTTPEALKESEFVDDIATIYYATAAIMFEDEQQLELQREFIWRSEEWQLEPPELKNGSKLTFGEFIDSKQIVQDMQALGASKWESMLRLCAIYLRKKDEPYSQKLVEEGSERIELMRELPMDIAIQVGFFLTSSLNIYNNISTSSKSQGLNLRENLQKSISIVTAGSTSSKALPKQKSLTFQI